MSLAQMLLIHETCALPCNVLTGRFLMSHAHTPNTATWRAPGKMSVIFSAHRVAAFLFLVQSVCMWGAFFVLAPSINWPASIDLPASEMLPLLLEKFPFVMSGYSLYLLHALVLIPLAVVLHSALGLSGPLGSTAVVFGVLAGLAKSLGIVRWIFMMPGLAASWVAPDASVATQAAISVIYEAFNAYAGGLGEVMGVGFFAGLWTLILSVALLDRGQTVLGFMGLAAAALLFVSLGSVLGIEMPILLTVSGIFWQLWTAALALWMGRSTGFLMAHNETG